MLVLFAMKGISLLVLSITFQRFRQVERQLMFEGVPSFEESVKNNFYPNNQLTITLKQKVKVLSWNETSPEQRQKVHFLGRSQLTRRDTFSASWLQSTQDFMRMNLTRITFCEAAAFAAFARRTHKLRMTLDYLDLSVEHLSKWWKILYFQRNQVAYDSIIYHLDQYIRRYDQFPTPIQPIFGNTLALIAFMPYGKKDDERGFHLTVVSLAATLESLRRAQMGRVVVIGLLEDDKYFVRDAFRYLADTVPFQHMEVTFVQGSLAYGYTKFDNINVPRAALYGVKEAFNISLMAVSERTEFQTQYMNEWFGDDREASHWKYVYLTEPDSILQTRPSTLQAIKDEVDNGGIFAPHRLQPIPHESDLPYMGKQFYSLKDGDGFQSVVELDAHAGHHDVCCDEYSGKDFKPGLHSFDNCGVGRWWACGFGRHKDNEDDPHMRLRPYQLMRLSKGTGLVTIAGTLHGRRCIAAKESVCEPPQTADNDGRVLW